MGLSVFLGFPAPGASAADPGAETLLKALEDAQEDYRLPEYYALARRFLTRYPSHPQRDAVRSELALQLIAENVQQPQSPGAKEARALLTRQEQQARSVSDRFDAALLLLKFGGIEDPAALEAAADRVRRKYAEVEGVLEVEVWAIARLEELDQAERAARRAQKILDRVEGETKTDYQRLIARAKLLGRALPLSEAERSTLGLAGKKVVLLDFWASWCRPCLEAQPALVAFQQAHQKEGLWIVGINLDEDPKDAEAHPSPLPQLHGKAAGVDERFGITQLPTYVLVDQHGKIVATELEGEKLYARAEALLKAP